LIISYNTKSIFWKTSSSQSALPYIYSTLPQQVTLLVLMIVA